MLAIAVTLAAGWSLSLTAATIIAQADTRLAHAIAPGDGIVAAKFAQDAFTASPTADANAAAPKLARAALLREPAAVEAVNVIGLQDQLRGRPEEAQAATRYGLELSRRELRLHLSRIEEAVSAGDVATALRHYDLALRTSSEANEMLLRTLAAALVEPRIRESVTAILQSRPTWSANFIDTAAAGERNPEGAALFFADRRNAALPISEEQRGKLVGALLKHRKFDQAWRYYASFRKDARRDMSRDGTFEDLAIGTNPLEWRQGDEPALGSAIVPDAKGGSIVLAAPAGIGGVVAAQTLLLPAGTYRLSGRYEGVRVPANARPVWTITCPDGAVAARIPVGGEAAGTTAFEGLFSVSGQCPSQDLALEVRPVDVAGGVSGTIRSVFVRPAR